MKLYEKKFLKEEETVGNKEIITSFSSGNPPNTKRKSANLKIEKLTDRNDDVKGWGLVNYSTTIAIRTARGVFYKVDNWPTMTTKKILRGVRSILTQDGHEYIEVEHDALREIKHKLERGAPLGRYSNSLLSPEENEPESAEPNQENEEQQECAPFKIYKPFFKEAIKPLDMHKGVDVGTAALHPDSKKIFKNPAIAAQQLQKGEQPELNDDYTAVGNKIVPKRDVEAKMGIKEEEDEEEY